jgi:prepilin-type N-terminal cleavage/methylation domain-containing protein
VSSLDSTTKKAGFTLVEVLVAAAVFGIFSLALLSTWSALLSSSFNNIQFARAQNDQMRTFDYLKRDIRRATTVSLYNNGTLVTGVNNWGNTLQLTMQKYYTDSRLEDDAIGSRTINTPTLTNGAVTYGTPFTVQYYISNGAIIRSEAGTLTTVSDGSAGFTLSFSNDTTGLIRCRVLYNQPMRSGTNRILTRQVDALFGVRDQL